MRKMTMYRICALLVTVVLLFGMVACTKENKPTTQTTPTTTQPNTTPTTPPTTQPPTPVQVTVMLDAQGGACETDSVILTVGQPYGILPEPALEGFVFLGWFTAEDLPITPESLVESAQPHTLFAKWEVQTQFTVSLDPNGGRISPYWAQVTVTVGQPYAAMPTPIREGYNFLGWFTQPEKGTQIKENTVFEGAEDLTLYAHWDYDALAYWTHILESRVQTIPYCRRVVVYLERNAGYKTFIDSDFLDAAGAINPAQDLEDYKVTDEWIREQNPYIIVKFASDIDMGLVYKIAMQRRFPHMEIYIFPTSVVTGGPKVQLYYRLQLAKILYPEYFEDVDLKQVKKELNISPRIYY